VDVSEESWHLARLIPTSGISGAEEQERRATSALLAVMGCVKEFSRALLSPLGAPAGNVETYIEVPFVVGEKKYFPDGLIRVTRGSRSWTALVEVKTGRNELQPEQLETYLDIAKDHDFDALITISNQIPAIAGQHPTKLDRRKLRKVDLHHWSWAMVLATAVMQKDHKGVSDPEQAWILGELIRYLEHPKSGALELEDMGANWVSVRQAVTTGTLRAADKTVPDVVARFDALLRYTALRLGRQLGTDVLHVLSRKEMADPAVRAQSLLDGLVQRGVLTGAICIPNTVGPINIEADLRAGQITCSIDIDAPQQGRPATRVNWLVRQLKAAPEGVRVEAFLANSRGAGSTELLRVVREDPQALITDPKRDIRSFRIALTAPMGSKRGRGRGSFIDSVLDLVDVFYADVVQNLKAWSAAPPRMREPEPVPEPAALASTALSSQDGAETAPREGGVASATPSQEGADPTGAEPVHASESSDTV
jgi:hypothetical protein